MFALFAVLAACESVNLYVSLLDGLQSSTCSELQPCLSLGQALGQYNGSDGDDLLLWLAPGVYQGAENLNFLLPAVNVSLQKWETTSPGEVVLDGEDTYERCLTARGPLALKEIILKGCENGFCLTLLIIWICWS